MLNSFRRYASRPVPWFRFICSSCSRCVSSWYSSLTLASSAFSSRPLPTVCCSLFSFCCCSEMSRSFSSPCFRFSCWMFSVSFFDFSNCSLMLDSSSVIFFFRSSSFLIFSFSSSFCCFRCFKSISSSFFSIRNRRFCSNSTL